MNNAMYQGLFLDDRQDQAIFVPYLTVEGESGLTTEFQLVQHQALEEMASTILERHPDILALDYRLDDSQDGVRYKAGPLAQQLRDHASELPNDDFPIVLLSHENIIQEQYGHDLTTHDLFDRVYAKEELATHKQRIGKELLALIEGYKQIINTLGDGTRLLQLLGLSDDERGAALLNNQELRGWQELKAPHLLAKKIIRNIIDRNGLLLDPCSVLARLGIAKDSPDADAFLTTLEIDNASYRGIFHGGWKRWWSHRIEVFGEQACGDELGNLTAKERVECWNRLFNLKLEAAKSRWTQSDETFPSFACASCAHPTEKIHSVAAFDHAPSFVERKRICWQCIATGVYEDENKRLIPEDAEAYIVEKIKNGEIKGEA